MQRTGPVWVSMRVRVPGRPLPSRPSRSASLVYSCAMVGSAAGMAGSRGCGWSGEAGERVSDDPPVVERDGGRRVEDFGGREPAGVLGVVGGLRDGLAGQLDDVDAA